MSLPEFIEIGTARTSPPSLADPEARIARNRELLARSLNSRTTVAFVGAGATRPLGYPSWPQLSREILEKVSDALSESDDRSPERKVFVAKLSEYITRLSSDPAPGAQTLTYMIDICQRSFHQFGCAREAYREYFRSLENRRRSASSEDPCSALMDLPVYRFVTTNYDTEIEQALIKRREVLEEDFGIAGKKPSDDNPPLSFTQEPEFRDELALFALSRVQLTRNLVFHCHGRWDRPNSIVASEQDYQKWYLREREPASSSFLQTIQLLFSSNPILFVGYGVQDEDLLRPLRMFGAIDPARRWNRPLFALMDSSGSLEEHEYFEQLFNRYGVHVIPFDRPSQRDRDAWGHALCSAIRRLGRERIEWRIRWSRKPQLRKVRVDCRPPEPYWHYHIQTAPQEELAPHGTAENVRRLWEKVLERPRVLPVIGPGGTGKSWHAIRLMERLSENRGPFQGLFFWSSYYADDALTGIARALAYLDPDHRIRGARFDRLKKCLEKPHFLAFDGFERLLREAEERGVGEPGTVDARRLIEAITSETSQSTVLLTSRIWPSTLDDAEGRRRCGVAEKFSLHRIRTEDLLESTHFTALAPRQVSALCSLLDGHSYGLALAAALLRASSSLTVEQLEHLQVKLENQAPRNRVSRMIQHAIDALPEPHCRLARELLERIALFMSPVSRAVLEVCFQDACEAQSARTPSPKLEDLITLLMSRRLLFRVAGRPHDPSRIRFTTHATVRSFIATREHQSQTNDLPNFTLTGFTSGGRLVSPGKKTAARTVTNLFNRLLETCRGSHDRGHPVDAGRLCRGAFGILRSKMEALTVPHWTSYSAYVQLGFEVLNVVRRVSPESWDHRERHDIAAAESDDAPLYADEVAWLYNDLGLALHCEGDFPAAHIVWDQGYEVNKLIDGDPGGPYVVQSLLHFGAAYIERGDLDAAALYLDDTAKVNLTLDDPDYLARTLGYQGLVAHLRGDFDSAKDLYERSLGMLAELGYNRRARAWFQHHYGNLLIRRDKFAKANNVLQSSLALAKLAQAPDLEFYARNALAHLLRAQGKFPEAGAEYQAALFGVRTMGIRKLEADILSELSRLALDIGDVEGARWHASQSLRIANELGLGLRQTHSLVVMGISSARGGQRELGIAYLRLALRLARHQGYLTRAREAERALRSLGEDDDRWSPSSDGQE